MKIIVKRQVIFDFDMTPDVHLGMKSETTLFSTGQEHYMINKHATGKINISLVWNLSAKNTTK
ncbi:MAG: hypothetical protein CVU51_16955 [Deltaproteobacteria bacterium HGW-Deltaproteobacteria-1]|jgi:hypothetical protein|nr:MAG: hypothetical protein CVU51_16955 [Deltaproteobacteria bacterium HGW-Deltaproteobacteria-1]